MSTTLTPEFINARKQVANDWRQNAYECHKQLSDVTETQKDKQLQYDLKYADQIDQGLHDNQFTINHRINQVLNLV